MTRPTSFTIRLFRKEKRTGAELCPAVASGIVTGDVPANVFFLSPVKFPEIFAKKLAPVSFSFLKSRITLFEDSVCQLCHIVSNMFSHCHIDVLVKHFLPNRFFFRMVICRVY